MSEGSAKFIGRNRPPRVHIEYEVEIYGSRKKFDLPFVMGVMADLAGKSESDEAQKSIADRKYLEIDVDNFEDRMKAIRPRVAFNVPNTLTGEGNLPVDITFESLDDFSPAAVANKVDATRQLLQARTQLDNLLTYMDGKAGAEKLIKQVLEDPTLLQSLAAAPKPDGESEIADSSGDTDSPVTDGDADSPASDSGSEE